MFRASFVDSCTQKSTDDEQMLGPSVAAMDEVHARWNGRQIDAQLALSDCFGLVYHLPHGIEERHLCSFWQSFEDHLIPGRIGKAMGDGWMGLVAETAGQSNCEETDANRLVTNDFKP